MKKPLKTKDKQIVLSRREHDIVKFLNKGLTNAEIVKVSEYTANQVHNSINKMLLLAGVQNRLALVHQFKKGLFQRGRK